MVILTFCSGGVTEKRGARPTREKQLQKHPLPLANGKCQAQAALVFLRSFIDIY